MGNEILELEFLKIIVVFLIIFTFVKIKNIESGILSGILSLAILRRVNFKVFVNSWINGFVLHYDLIFIVFLALLLVNMMGENKFIERLLNSTKTVLTNQKYVLFAIPALIGMLPLPAGALVSGKMISPLREKLGIKREEITFYNYWFRHIWEHSWPIYPAVILSSALLHCPIYEVIKHQFPFTLFTCIIGLIMLKKIKYEIKEEKIKDYVGFLISSSPITIVILLGIFFKIPFYYALLFAVLIILPTMKKESIVKVLKSPPIGMTLLIYLIMVFRELIVSSGSINVFVEFLKKYNVPPLLMIFLLPFVSAVTTGIASGYVGISYPFLLPFLISQGSANWGNIILAYESGYLGLTLTPMHLCFSTTVKLYKASFSKVYKILVLPAFLTFLFAIVLYFLY